MEKAADHKESGGSTESRSFKEYIEWVSGNLDRAPWARSLPDIAAGGVDLFDYIATHCTQSGEEPPSVSDLAVPMIRTGIEMLRWRYPDSPVAEAVNAIRDLPDKLERLIEDELKGLLEEVF